MVDLKQSALLYAFANTIEEKLEILEKYMNKKLSFLSYKTYLLELSIIRNLLFLDVLIDDRKRRITIYQHFSMAL